MLKAIRENEPRAISLGYDADRYKLIAFVLSAALAGLAGATKAIVFQLASLTDVHWTMSGEVVLMTLLGGLGTVFGPVVGAAVIIAMQNYLAQLGAWVTVVQGVIFVICVLAFRRGIDRRARELAEEAALAAGASRRHTLADESRRGRRRGGSNMSKRMTKGEFQESLGALNPVGHAVLAFADDATAADAKAALLQAGFGGEDILTYTSAELFPNLDEMMRKASGAAGFGYEITLMRRYMTLAGEGCGWLVVYAPDDEHTFKVTEVAKRFGAKSAVHYGRLLHEDLV